MATATALDDRAITDGLFVVASAPAGWYVVGEGIRRWFDGRRWTDYYAPVLTFAPELDPMKTYFRTEHGFHLIMVVMTLGVWAPIWATVTVCNIIRSTAPVSSRV